MKDSFKLMYGTFSALINDSRRGYLTDIFHGLIDITSSRILRYYRLNCDVHKASIYAGVELFSRTEPVLENHVAKTKITRAKMRGNKYIVYPLNESPNERYFSLINHVPKHNLVLKGSYYNRCSILYYTCRGDIHLF